MRLKNVRGASEILANSNYVIKEYKEYKEKFNTLFANKNDIKIEVGMGKGDFIIGNAIKYPNVNFIGIEKFDSVLVRAVQKVESLEQHLPNLRFIRMDATEITDVFKNEIHTLYLNFSDPWPKNRHENRRLSSKLFLKRYDNIFSDVKRIEMKTDNRKLFEFSIISIANYGYLVEDISLNLYEDDIKDNIPTEYETRFHNLGFPIYKIVASDTRHLIDKN